MRVKSRNHRRRLSTHSLFFRLVITYAIVLLLPTVSILVLVRWSVQEAMVDQVADGTAQSLERLSLEFDSVLLGLDRIAVAILSNRPIMQSNNESRFGRINVRNLIQNYKFVSGHVYDIMHIRFSDQVIYTANVVADPDTVLTVYYPFPETSRGHSLDMLRTIQVPTIEPPVQFWFPGAGTRFLVPYFWPFPTGGPDTVVLFLIDVQSVRDLIARAAPPDIDGVSITNTAGELLFSWQRGSSQGPSKTNLYSTFRSEKTGLVYQSTVSADSVLSGVRRIQILGSISALLAFLIGAVVIALGIRFNYRPIRELADRVAHYVLASPSAIDEIEQVRIAVDSVVDENKQLTTRIEVLRPVMREFLLRELIDRAGTSITESSRIALLIDNDRPNSTLLLVGSMRVAMNHELAWEQALKTLSAYQEPNWAVVIPHDDSGYATLVAADEGGDCARLKLFARQIIGELPVFAAGFSCLYRDILETSEAYVQSMRALRAALGHHTRPEPASLGSVEPIAMFLDEYQDDHEDTDWELASNELSLFGASRALSRFLESGNAEAARSEVDRVFESMSQNAVPSLFARCVVFDLYKVIFRLALGNNLDLVRILGSDAASFVARAHRKLPDLAETLRSACDRLVLELLPNGPNENSPVKRALQILRKRFCEPTFSLEQLSSEVGVSLPHLSRLFRSNESVTLSDFLWMLRQERAKQLLIETSMPIHEIARAVGYVDTSSFIRRFKAFEKTPPGEWRTINATDRRSP